MAPNHPITKHLAVGYWKGVDLAVEEVLYRPQHIEKIVAWGGLASVKHVTRYIQPGLELIALDPKRSATIIGAEAFADEATLRDVAQRAAIDIGVANQEGCANARVIYVLSGTDDPGLANANKLGQMIYRELIALPPFISTPPLYPDRDLFEHLETSRMTDDFYRVFGGEQRPAAEGLQLVQLPHQPAQVLAHALQQLLEPAVAQRPPPLPPSSASPLHSPPIVGLFPEPGASR